MAEVTQERGEDSSLEKISGSVDCRPWNMQEAGRVESGPHAIL